MLSRSSALEGQFCLPERKKKRKGQVNNLRISYIFCWEKNQYFIYVLSVYFWIIRSIPSSFNLNSLRGVWYRFEPLSIHLLAILNNHELCWIAVHVHEL